MDYIYTYTTQNARINKENIPTTLITINVASQLDFVSPKYFSYPQGKRKQ